MNVSESIDWRHSTPGELDLHRFIGLTRRGQTLDGYLSCFMQNGWWTLTDADNLVTVIKPDANGNPTLNTELFRSPSTYSRKYDHEKNYISPPQNYINHHRFLH